MSPSSESAPDPGGRGGGGGGGAKPRADGGRAQPPDIPGLVLRARLRDAGAGQVWSGRVEATGVECTVRHLPLPASGPARDEVVRAAEKLVDLRHPHLVTVTDVIPHDDGLAVVAVPVAGAISLSRLLGVRERIEPGEVVTVGLPMAQALAAAHAAEVVHGSLTSEDILLEPNGRPMLAGVGLAGLLRLVGTPAADVRDLADLLLDTMLEATGPDAAAVAVAVATALVDDPRQRPSADELAAALGRSCRPVAVRLVSEPIEPLSMPPPPPGVDPKALSRRRRPSSGPTSPSDPPASDAPAASPANIVPPGIAVPSRARKPGRSGEPPRNGRRSPKRFGPTTIPRAVALPALPPQSAATPVPDASPSAPTSQVSGPASTAPASTGGGDETTVPRPGPSGEPSAVPAAPPGAANPNAASPDETSLDAGGPDDRNAQPVELSPIPTHDERGGRAEATVLLRGTPTPDARPGARSKGREREGAAPSRSRAAGGRASTSPGESANGGATRSARPGSGRPSSGRPGSGRAGSGRPSSGRADSGRPGSGRAGSGHSARRLRAGARPRRGRWLLPAIGVVGVVAVAITLVAMLGGSSESHGRTDAPTGITGGGGVESSPVGEQTAEQRWQSQLEALNDARAAAFENADENALALVYAAGGSALAQDTGKMRQMVALGAHATGLGSVIESLEITEEGSERTVLRVTDRQEPYTFLAADGTVLSQQTGKPPQTRNITLVKTADGWRIAQITDVE